ncbi:subtilisin-like protease SBT3.18 isoform X1 [Amborella trichopoda]|uniref:Inhibitor I9 domain-containing protein n=1 Tax=Amborella trichopoda TaxID=13333 RepID=W1NDH5_AMBTC|nr:subtilisin-like protease SBT3.18 isoform X1 [Amborella trichopoda]ERM93537.1 hypothetical protein AMTR_s00004p00071240 [Amborella trichopoda]|eukprot:XP_020519968.1 subtilisin-like protease SBT3.18 isoform X1 [Amborella trichopoda]
MATFLKAYLVIFFSLPLFYTPLVATNEVYIVYLGLNHLDDPLLTTKYHLQLLSKVFSSEDEAKEAMVYSYKHIFSGFAAKLNSTQAATLASLEGVISSFKSKVVKLHTTRSWDFMGLTMDYDEAIPVQEAFGEDIIVGVFDTGIWPESKSFREDPSLGPVPSSWKGECIAGEQFSPSLCNKKLIGARYYIKGYEHDIGPLNKSSNPEFRSSRDRLGHGTHTSSTAVGSPVAGAGFGGLAMGLARGGAPRARLAIYKICWSPGYCSEIDILGAFEDAIKDGVHVISASFGASPPLRPYLSSSADIGSFHAMQRGIHVIFSGGNSGSDPSLVENVTPWATCVGATTLDRHFPTQIILGSTNITFLGEGFIDQTLKLPLVDGSSISTTGACDVNKLIPRLAFRKVVLCFSTGGDSSTIAGLAVYLAGGSALIFSQPSTKRIPDVSFIPILHVDINQGTQILFYIQTLKNPSVQINPSRTSVEDGPAPKVAYFSSRGPSSLSPAILKPDLSGPGVNILAAWPPILPPSSVPIDRRIVNWNLLSGTSMACPHVAGIVALLKSAHPYWSPAAIKSALMTTAYTRDTSGDRILAGGTVKAVDPFDIGAGHVNPLKAFDPGLVYDLDALDYVPFLCALGYNEAQIGKLVNQVKIDCSKLSSFEMEDLNYPSITVPNLQSRATIKRTLTNVGQKRAIYFADFVSPEGVEVQVWPNVLIFTKHLQKLSYYVTLTPTKYSKGRYDFGEIMWFDGYHSVRSPLVVCVNLQMPHEGTNFSSGEEVTRARVSLTMVEQVSHTIVKSFMVE